MKKLIKQILFLFCILVNVTLFISLVDILKGVLNDKPESYVIGLPCTYNVIISVSLLLFGSLVATYVLLKDDSFE
jgi:hypothetical protein